MDGHRRNPQHEASFWGPPVTQAQTLHGTAIYTYIDPSNHPNVGIYIYIHGVSGKVLLGQQKHVKASSDLQLVE